MLRRLSHTRAALAARSVAAAATLAAALCPVLATGSGTAEAAASSAIAIGTVDAISCTSAGSCVAIGDLDPPSTKVLFTVTERNGVWGSARAIPGIVALLGHHRPFGSQVMGMSCSSAGNCGAGGYYAPGPSDVQGLVVGERKGTWGKAQAVRGLAALNVGKNAEVDAVSCPSAGNCSAGGFYSLNLKNILANTEIFLVSEKNGVWGKAETVPGTLKLNTGHNAGFDQMACTSGGNCLGVGFYTRKHVDVPFSITEKNGNWGTAQAIPAFPVANSAAITSIACQSAGNCTGVGNYRAPGGDFTVFDISQVNGTWGPVTPIPGMAALPPDGAVNPHIGSLTCTSAGNCTAGGGYDDPSNIQREQPFVVTETNGTWGNAQVLPGVAALSTSKFGALFSAVACPSPGNCSATGLYFTKGGDEVFVSTEQGGVWGTATELPGIAALNVGKDASTPRLACGAPGNCSLGGFYALRAPRHEQIVKPYLASEKNGIWGKAREVRGINP